MDEGGLDSGKHQSMGNRLVIGITASNNGNNTLSESHTDNGPSP